jgi:hypothetical protein
MTDQGCELVWGIDKILPKCASLQLFPGLFVKQCRGVVQWDAQVWLSRGEPR